MKVAISVVACVVVVVVAVAAGPFVKRQVAETYTLPDGAALVLGNIVGGFTCEGRIYGYYADVANGCRIFHVCVPILQEEGPPQTIQYSFFCGNQTVFDQLNLVCATETDAVPCGQAESLYADVNEKFGRTDIPFRT